MLAFRLAHLTGMSLRFPLFRGVKHFCCKPSKRRYCLRVEQKRLWKICQESACALLVPKHGRLKKKCEKFQKAPSDCFLGNKRSTYGLAFPSYCISRYTKQTAWSRWVTRQKRNNDLYVPPVQIIHFSLSIKTFFNIIAFGQPIRRVWLSEDHPLPQGVKSIWRGVRISGYPKAGHSILK